MFGALKAQSKVVVHGHFQFEKNPDTIKKSRKFTYIWTYTLNHPVIALQSLAGAAETLHFLLC
jgi:hypothetical protein